MAALDSVPGSDVPGFMQPGFVGLDIVNVNGSDSASGIEGSPSVASSFSDTASGAERSPSVAVTGSDTTSSSDTSSRASFVVFMDSVPGRVQPSYLWPSFVGASTVSVSSSDSATGSDTSLLSVSVSDTSSVTENRSINAALSSSDSSTGGDTGSASSTTPSDTDSVSATELFTIAATFSSADNVSATNFGLAINLADLNTKIYGLVVGPTTIYVGDYGITEPSDLSTLGSPWVDLGATDGEVALTVKQEYKPMDMDSLVMNPGSRLIKRELTVKMVLAEPTLQNLVYSLNNGSITTGAGFKSYVAPTVDPSMSPLGTSNLLMYRTVVIDGWAPPTTPFGAQKRRRLVLRKCLSAEDVEFTYSKDRQTVLPITWRTHYINKTVAPFTIIDEL